MIVARLLRRSSLDGVEHDLEMLRRRRDEVDDVLVEGDDSDAVALLLGEYGERGREKPGVVELGEASALEAHGARDVEKEREAGVGVRLELLHVEPVGAGEEPPVDAADIVPRHVGAVLGEVDGSPEVGRAVEAADEPLDHRARQEVQVRDPRQDVRVHETVEALASRCLPSIGSPGHATSSTSVSKRPRAAGPRCARTSPAPTARGSW